MSRGVQSTRWLGGLSFLWENEGHWPTPPAAINNVTDDDPEVRAMKVCAVTAVKEDATGPMGQLTSHYSEKRALLRGVAWIARVIRTLKERLVGVTNEPFPLCLEELRDAEKKIIMWAQKHAFFNDYEDLLAGREVRKTSRLVKLNPVMKDGIIRAGGRLAEASLAEETKHPVIIPSSGHFTKLLVQDAHEIVGHGGRQLTLAKLRKRFWIIRGNASVRRVLAGCVGCAKRYRTPETQKMANLPSDRVQALEPPFTRTGVDCFGPFYVTQGRSRVKRYGVLFTCLSIRAVHS